jgi:hypothetical protein
VGGLYINAPSGRFQGFLSYLTSHVCVRFHNESSFSVDFQGDLAWISSIQWRNNQPVSILGRTLLFSRSTASRSCANVNTPFKVECQSSDRERAHLFTHHFFYLMGVGVR